MIDELLIRDLNRIVNDRDVGYHYRETARRAVLKLMQAGGENEDAEVVEDETTWEERTRARNEREEAWAKLRGIEL